ncbi:8'-apo-carotenoid 13,14-cleaving dioxygenase [Gluconacetobacter takamatsuzukensis]|uniref:Dioxygenase n=1 Tax=Gluconacetobacter takamatsuzukensis TaxID=1286190 RepID=A0A7W4PS58_9PROT|nr:carotenoid oxygenase family protein [Gluconacetobacter takamatsuzukensis]MBB2204581.1 carotenoid oxygenase [Gluconacetobacter takamatsuzukensis]
MGSPIETLIRETVTRGIEALAAHNRKRMPRHANPFLTGIHAPMTEERTLTELPVTGTIPAGLNGRYLRIGPNPIAPDPASYHWFTGDGMVHGLAIADGRALWYRNRWIRSNAVARARGVVPAPGPRHVFDTVNTNVVDIGGRTFALVEAGSYPVELGETLDDQRYNPFDGSLKGSFSAHPHRDPKTGEQHAICYEGRDPGTIRHVVVDAAGRVIREEPVAVKHGPMIHDCALTDRFVIILDLPVTFSMKALVAGHGFPYRWNPAHPARVGLLPRHGGQDDIIWCPVAPGYAFHVANAHDADDGSVILDLCVYDTMFGDGAQGPDARSRGLERWTIDPAGRMVAIRTLDAAPQEFPRPDERFFGRPSRHVWSLALPADPANRFIGATALYAHDLVTGERQVHDFGPNRHPGEFVFVPETPDSPEGHGWLIGFVIDMASETTDLVILDARRFSEPPVAGIRLPHRVPPGFHGNWIAGGSTP